MSGINDDIELARAAILITGEKIKAMRMLRDECGWTLRKAHDIFIYISDDEISSIVYGTRSS